jgi:flagellar hook-associated protein 3 FlgL
VTERITELMRAGSTVSTLANTLAKLDHARTELSTGRRINQPSDDPFGAGNAVSLNGQLGALSAYANNITDGSAWAEQADSSLTTITDNTQRARELVVEAANGTTNPSDLAAAAAEIDQITESVKQAANSEVSGQYIFSGTDTATAPYLAGANDAFQGNTATMSRTIAPGGTTIQVNFDVSSLLGSGQPAADGKLLNTLRDVAQDMRAGNQVALGNDLQKLDTNVDTLGQLQASVGATELRLNLAASRVADLQVQVQKQLSNTEDVDMAQAITDYSTQQASYSAALQVSAQMLQNDSLVNFLR